MNSALGQPQVDPLLGNTVISQPPPRVFATHFKAITAGKNNIEIYHYSKPILINHQGYPKKLKIPTIDDVLDILTNPDKYQPTDRSAEYKQRSINKATNRIRRLVQANFDTVGKFLTFDFRDTDTFDIHSLSDCHEKYAQFIRKLRRKFPTMKYVVVPEFQDTNHRGAVHYHVILDIPFIPWKKLLQMWGHGRIYIQKIDNPANVGVYVAKYVSKALNDKRYVGHRCFYSSKNLIQPTVQYGDNLQAVITAFEANGIIPAYINTYHSDWCGEITYRSYNRYQLPAQEKEIHGSD